MQEKNKYQCNIKRQDDKQYIAFEGRQPCRNLRSIKFETTEEY